MYKLHFDTKFNHCQLFFYSCKLEKIWNKIYRETRRKLNVFSTLKIELSALSNARWPSRSNRFKLRVKPYSFHPMNRGAAKKRSLPTTKTVHCNRNRDGYVNANHAHFNIRCKVPSSITIPCKNGCAISIFMVID